MANWRWPFADIVLVWLALAQGAFSILWVLIPIAGFAALVVIHEKLLKELERRRRAARFYEKALARLDGNWAGTGEPGDRYQRGLPSLRAGSRPLWKGQRLRIAVHGAHADRRRPPGAVAEISGRARSGARAPCRRGGTARSRGFARGTRHCRRRGALRRRSGTVWRNGARRKPRCGIPPSVCASACTPRSDWPVLRRSGFTWCERPT